MKIARQLALGLDYGSDSARAVLVDCASGEEVASAVAAYPRWSRGLYCDPASQRFRQHPQDYLDVLRTIVRAVLRQAGPGAAGELVGIGIDTTGSTPIAVDRAGVALALRPEFAEDPDAMFVLWKDHTAIAEAETFNDVCHSGRFPDVTRYIGGRYSSEWWWAKIAHILRVNRKVATAAWSWVEHCDWLPALLCGTSDPLAVPRSRCAAGHKACWHPDWDGLPPEELLVAVEPRLRGLRARLPSQTMTSDQPAGRLSQEWAKRLGLPAGLTVAVGAFDAHLGAVGAGAKPFVLTKVMGTSTCDMMIAPATALGERCIRGICGQVDGSIVPGMIGLEAGQSAFGDVYAWFKNLLAWPLAGLPSATRAACLDRLLPDLETAAAAIPPGSSGVIATDWFNGRRTPDADQRLRASLVGLHLGHEAPALYRALVEATACGARAIVERFVAEGVTVRAVLALGGIARKSSFVMQVCADVMQRPIDVVSSDQCCARGSAIAAAVAAGVYPSIPAAQRRMASPVERRYRPQRRWRQAYDEIYAAYQGLAPDA